MKAKLIQAVGVVGVIACILIYAVKPSFPTPDKIFIFLVFVFMVARHAKEFIKHLAPFVGLILVYESFRGIVPKLNNRVEYNWMPDADKWLFNELPTRSLQRLLWHGHVQWFDMVMYLVYTMHFIVPIALLLLVWRYREQIYWQVVTSYVVVSFLGFLTFLLYPAAPPWMASDRGVIEPIVRISSNVWYALGIHDFPSVYSKIAPNPVAAVPSLHASFATMFAIFIFKFFGKKWGALSLAYPATIYFGTVYQGEHYAIDEIIGAAYALVVYLVVDWYFKNRRAKP